MSQSRLWKYAMRASLASIAAIAATATLIDATAWSHGNEARMVEFLNWKKMPNIARVFGANRAHLEGTPSGSVRPQIRMVEGQSCIVGQVIGFDVDDRYAFDIDEPVELSVTYATAYTSPFVIGWDKSGGSGAGVIEITPAPGETFTTAKVTLDRARLAGQATQGADIAIGAPNGIVVCSIEVVRSNKTIVPEAYGRVKLTLRDAKTGGLVPARLGLYDKTGRAPLASDKSLMLQRFADDLRMLAANERTFWPSENRQVFYADGNYETRVPVGTYELVASRGIEYKFHRSQIEVTKDKTTEVTIDLQRYADMPAAGWYSGDAHIHVTRDEVADPQLWGFVSAEDVHVGNLLEMGNVQNVYFHQPKAWGKASRFERDGHFIVSGQESPRTGQFGHTIHFNIQRPVHLKTDEYFLYHKVFQEVASQPGGISGFAHMGWRGAGEQGNRTGQMNRGMALLAPLGLVDFIEVLQGGRLVNEGWYRLLNLGYRVKPAAGTDWPYSDFPGVVRFYVKVDGPFNLDSWFASYDKGRTFVTNGPLLDFTINGKGIGEELRVKRGTRLDVAAAARLNPQLDKLDRLELVVLGDVDATQSADGKESVSLRKELTAEHSMWVAVRAFGARQDPRNTTIAHSAPIYVVVDDEPTWKREAVPEIVAELRGRVQRILTDPIDTPISGNEVWETRLTLQDQWLLQQPLLKPTVDAADAAYQKLLDRHARFAAPAPATVGSTR
ncbi:MAG TPA: CehA/McbA family metallohydrolase [Steroidobacteraceae bacterium]